MLERLLAARAVSRALISHSPRILLVGIASACAFALMAMSSGRSGATDMAGALPPEQQHDSVRLALPSVDGLDLGLEPTSLYQTFIGPDGGQPAQGRPNDDVPLTSGVLRSVVKRLRNGLPPTRGIGLVDGAEVQVEILHSMSSGGVAGLVSGFGGTIVGEVPGFLAQAWVPYDRLVELEEHPRVLAVRPPLEANVPLGTTSNGMPPTSDAPVNPPVVLTGQEVAKTNADSWHTAGFTGTGVKVGIIDYFDGTYWNNAQAAGELPAPAGTFCRVNGVPCNIWTGGSKHGEGVGEIIHEMAPDAQLYLATAITTADLQAAVTYFAGQGVDLISRSLTAQYDGPGDGTGPIATVIDDAVANSMTWFQSAGNSASDGSFTGQYYRATYTDINGDGIHEFAPGVQRMAFICPFTSGVRWSDFGEGGVTDFDVYVYDNLSDSIPISLGMDDQTAGAPPLEHNIACTNTVDYLEIRLFNAGFDASTDVLEFKVNRGALTYWQNPYSASGPAADTASTGGVTVGAIDPPLGTTIAPYSSRGPTNDMRLKPDLSAASCVYSFTYAPGCFNGTSAATPVAAGAAALVIDAGLASTPAQIKSYLLGNATVDRGVAGDDMGYGVGELILPAPPATPTPSPSPSPTPSSTPLPDSDSDLDGFTYVVEMACGSDPLNGASIPERVDGAFAGADDDADLLTDEELPPGAEAYDCDRDGFPGSEEAHIFSGTGGLDQDPCGLDAWSLDFDGDSPPDSANKIDFRDLLTFILPVRHLGTSPGDAEFDVRWDLDPGPGVFGTDINIADMQRMVFSFPPMFGGSTRALNGPECPWPP